MLTYIYFYINLYINIQYRHYIYLQIVQKVLSNYVNGERNIEQTDIIIQPLHDETSPLIPFPLVLLSSLVHQNLGPPSVLKADDPVTTSWCRSSNALWKSFVKDLVSVLTWSLKVRQSDLSSVPVWVVVGGLALLVCGTRTLVGRTTFQRTVSQRRRDNVHV